MYIRLNLIILLFALPLFSYYRGSPVAYYKIKAKLIPEAHKVKAVLLTEWKNIYNEEIDRFYLHLYLNAFRKESTFVNEKLRRGPYPKITSEKSGEIRLNSVTVYYKGRDYKIDLRKDFFYIQPDSQNLKDKTLGVIKLPFRLKKGEKTRLKIEFTSTLPYIFARTGYSKDFFFVAQWFPKFCVYRKGWRGCHEFHANSEFFSDFTDYYVEIEVPIEFIVAGSGVKKEEKIIDDYKLYRFVSKRVHDFAWVAYPRFIVIEDRFNPIELKDEAYECWLRKNLRIERGELRLPETKIILYIPRDQLHQADRYIRAVKESLYWYGLWVGYYPYPVITMVSPPWFADNSGGMEYPTLISLRTSLFEPKYQHYTEGVVYHEFGHQYFYGILASNEFESPWLDEGLTTYFTGKLAKRIFGDWIDSYKIGKIPIKYSPIWEKDPDILRITSWGILPLFRDNPLGLFFMKSYDPSWSQLLRYLPYREKDRITNASWEFVDFKGSYRAMSYAKPTLMLWSLNKIFGDATMIKLIRYYYKKNRFSHPKKEDFLEAIRRILGERWKNIVEAILDSPDEINYSIDSVSCIKDRCYIRVVNKGTILKGIELDLWIRLKNGKVIKDKVSGFREDRRWVEKVIEGDIEEVILDPYYKFVLDSFRYDNFWRAKKSIKPSLKLIGDLLNPIMNLLLFFNDIL